MPFTLPAMVRPIAAISQTFHAVISGSLALKLALRHTEWMPGDVDIYVGADEYDLCVNAIAAAFNAVEVAMGTHNATTEAVHAGTGQAVPADAMLVEPSFSEGVDVVRRFQAPAVTFDIIKSNGDSFKPLASFHSTVVMNILTANRLIIGAPSFTLYGCGLQSYLYPNPKSLQALQKYERRGFAITYYATFEKGPGFGRALEIPLAGRMGNDGDEYDHLFDDMWERLRTL